MTITEEQFRERLTDSGLMSRAEVDSFQSDAPAASGGTADPNTLADALVDAGRLTAFQAETLLDPKQQPLRLGNYLLVDRVGAGGMGQVYKAVHERMKRVVAIKVLPPLAAMDEGLVARFRREVQVAAKLSHPNIVTAYDADESDGRHYLVMELVDGRDLGAIIEARGPLSLDVALDYIRQAAVALAYAHGEGVLHRDIKPGNLLVDASGTVKVLDMGLARLESSEGLTSTGDVIGSAHTMAPEQGDDIRLVDERSDVYALGCTLYYLLAGRHVYEGDSALRVLIKHAQEPVPRLRDACPDVPEEVEAVFQGMVQKKREDRFANMQAVLEALDALRAGKAPETPAPAPTGGRPGAPAAGLRMVGIGVLVAVAALVVWLVIDGSSGRDTPSGTAGEQVVTGATFERTLMGHQETINSLALHPDGKRLLSASSDNTIGIWRIEDGELLHQLEGHEDHVRSVICSRDGKTAYTASNDTTIRIWDLEKRTTRTVLMGHQEKVRKIALAPDETWIASASKDGSLRIWDLPAGDQRLERRRHGMGEDDSRGLLGVAVHPDGGSLATTAYDRTVRIWDTKDFEVQTTLGPHESDVGYVAFSPDGKHLLYDLANGKVRVMSADGTQEVSFLSGHLEWVYAIGFSADGSLVATGAQDLTVRIWSLPSGKLIDTLRGHEDTINAIVFTADGRRLISGSADDTIRIWRLERGPKKD
ncbi:MAG: serine/threonine-protein kinase [Planctomycetota bacterium]|nr:serine/threonine-protein kinase [Planctomycetota bacterium]